MIAVDGLALVAIACSIGARARFSIVVASAIAIDDGHLFIACHSRIGEVTCPLMSMTPKICGRYPPQSTLRLPRRPWRTVSASRRNVQSPSRGWRNNCIGGYRGESRRSIRQRSSASIGRSVQTGFPNAPAKCMTYASNKTTMSRCVRIAVSANPLTSVPSSLSENDPDDRRCRRVFFSACEPRSTVDCAKRGEFFELRAGLRHRLAVGAP